MHVEPDAQTCPQLPQLVVLETRFTHAPWQKPSPEGQVEQCALMHAGVDEGHTLPQAPQLFASPFVLTQAFPQSTSPDGHEHAPEEHTPPDGQGWPHAPQSFGSICRLSQPSSQSVKPLSHELTEQIPEAQNELPLAT